MRVEITHHPGVGDHLDGAIVDVDDQRAQRWIRTGYAKAAPSVSPKKAKEKS